MKTALQITTRTFALLGLLLAVSGCFATGSSSREYQTSTYSNGYMQGYTAGYQSAYQNQGYAGAAGSGSVYARQDAYGEYEDYPVIRP